MSLKSCFATLTLLCLVGSTISATAPNTVNFQGRLTDNGGNPVPDGAYLIKFRIYDDSAAGTTLWDSDFRQIQVTNGLFSYALGDTIPLPTTVFDDSARWVGIKVSTDPEISPRTRLTSVPYARRVGKIGPEIRLGTDPGEQGEIRLEQSGTVGLELDVIANGGGISFHNENGSTIATMGTEPEGFGFFFGGNDFLSRYISLVPDVDGVGSHRLVMLGDNSFMIWDGSKSGDSSLQLNNSVINDQELLESPGIASDLIAGSSVSITSTTNMQAVVGVTVENNTPGYFVVEATGQAGLSGTTSPNRMSVQIDDAPGGSQLTSYYHFVGFSSPPNTSTIYSSVSVRRVFFKNPGTHTFLLEAKDATGNGTKYIWNPVIVATFYARSYGGVNTVLPDTPAGMEAETATGQDQLSGETTTAYKVDLRQLELEAARANAEAQAAQRRLLEAKAEEMRQNEE